MARMIPMKYADSATYTEKRLFNIFRTKLDSKHYGLSEVYLKNSRADFIIVGKETGIIVFEVKDWKFETIIGKRNGKFIMCSKGSADRFSLDDPFDQLQKYRREIFDILVGNNIRIPKELQVDDNKWYKFGIREALVIFL